MKTGSKFLLIVLLFGLSLSSAQRAYSMAQISLQNNTSFWLNLYIDGNFGCGPVMPNGFCTSSVTPGSHLLDARKRGESNTFIGPEAVNIGEGTSPTWTVSYEDPNHDLIKKLNGARYVNQRNWPTIRAEYELKITRTTLVWRMRFTWAASNVTLPRPLDEWVELGQGQIVGREAHIYVQNPAPDDVAFTISEDGDSITGKESAGTFTFYRR
jgi:hypothetical protein